MQVEHKHRQTGEATTFGEILRRERQLRAISLSEISAATKISVSHLEALERNDFAALPGGAFSKGFLRAYALHVGLDPEEMVNHYLYEIAGRSEHDGAGRSADSEESIRSRQRWLVLGIAAILLLAGAALAAWWWLAGSPS